MLIFLQTTVTQITDGQLQAGHTSTGSGGSTVIQIGDGQLQAGYDTFDNGNGNDDSFEYARHARGLASVAGGAGDYSDSDDSDPDSDPDSSDDSSEFEIETPITTVRSGAKRRWDGSDSGERTKRVCLANYPSPPPSPDAPRKFTPKKLASKQLIPIKLTPPKKLTPKKPTPKILSPKTTPSTPEKAGKKGGSWSDEEHAAIEHALRELRANEASRGITGTKGIRDVALWSHISTELEGHSVTRSPSACKNYWSRYGRVRSGFDERAIPIPGQLATSLQ
jgi:hypothetical protein